MATAPKNIPHIQQPKDTNWCGACCLKMLYEFHGVEHPDLNRIWEYVRGMSWGTGSINCQTYLMAQHAQTVGLNSMVVSCEDPREMMNICQQNGIDMISLCRANLSTIYGHFVVFTGANYKGIYVNDPLLPENKGKNKLYKLGELLPLLRPIKQSTGKVAQDMCEAYTFLLVAPKTISTVTIIGKCPFECNTEQQAFSAILPLNPKILCLLHDKWFSSYDLKECE